MELCENPKIRGLRCMKESLESSGEVIYPASFKEGVLSLLSTHTESKLGELLGIKYSLLKSWIREKENVINRENRNIYDIEDIVGKRVEMESNITTDNGRVEVDPEIDSHIQQVSMNAGDITSPNNILNTGNTDNSPMGSDSYSSYSSFSSYSSNSVSSMPHRTPSSTQNTSSKQSRMKVENGQPLEDMQRTLTARITSSTVKGHGKNRKMDNMNNKKNKKNKGNKPNIRNIRNIRNIGNIGMNISECTRSKSKYMEENKSTINTKNKSKSKSKSKRKSNNKEKVPPSTPQHKINQNTSPTNKQRATQERDRRHPNIGKIKDKADIGESTSSNITLPPEASPIRFTIYQHLLDNIPNIHLQFTNQEINLLHNALALIATKLALNIKININNLN